MDSIELRNNIIELVCNQLSINKNELDLNKSFIEMGADSLDQVGIIISIENKLNINIPDVDCDNLNTVNKLITYVSNIKSNQSN